MTAEQHGLRRLLGEVAGLHLYVKEQGSALGNLQLGRPSMNCMLSRSCVCILELCRVARDNVTCNPAWCGFGQRHGGEIEAICGSLLIRVRERFVLV